MKTVFLGGTCNGSTWRDTLIPLLSNINYFNPVVANWTPECQAKEIEARNTSDFVLYVLTPKMTGVYSVAEVVDDSNKRPEKTLMLSLDTDGDVVFTPHQTKSPAATAKMVTANGGKTFASLQEVAEFLNNQ
jgi:hypothetical protein